MNSTSRCHKLLLISGIITAGAVGRGGRPGRLLLDDNSTGPLLTQIEASRNNPNWGLLWVDGTTAFAGLDQQGLLQKGFEPSVKWDTPGQQSLPSDKSYTPAGVTLTLSYLGQAFSGATAVAITNSLWVSAAAAALGLAIGFPIAWLAGRTTLPGRRFVAGSMRLRLLRHPGGPRRACRAAPGPGRLPRVQRRAGSTAAACPGQPPDGIEATGT